MSYITVIFVLWGHTTCFSLGGNENEEKSEVQAIIESTPELDMDKDLSGYKGSR